MPSRTANPLDDRKRRVLRAIVTEYIAMGEPVGSRRVVEVASLDVSPATVRNDMAALEELGLIHQPHTSAGRVPTDAGYRAFVDDLQQRGGGEEPRREFVQELLSGARDLDDLLGRTSTVLSQLTRLVALVIGPAVETAVVRLLELVSLSARAALLLVVSDTGTVDKRYVVFEEPVSEADLDRVRTALREHATGRKVKDVAVVVDDLAAEAPSDLRGVFTAVASAARDDLGDPPVHQVYVGGQASLAEDEAFHGEALIRVLELLDERNTLAQVISEASDAPSPRVIIGAENPVEELRSASVVAKGYRLFTAGSLGVLGPTRMDYARVLATVRAVAEELEQSLVGLDS